MEVKVQHMGWQGGERPVHVYRILTANGHADEIREPTYTSATVMEMPDELWTEGSGWADLMCEECGWEYRERCRPGIVVECPRCNYPELIPDDAILEDSNLMEDDYVE